MEKRIKLLNVGYIIFAVFFCVFASLYQPVQAANTGIVTVGGTPYAVAVTPDGKYAYVPNGESVAIIDTTTNKVTRTVATQNWPTGVAITPDGKYAYVTETNTPTNQDGLVSVIDIASNAVTSTITIGGKPNRGVAITPDGKYAYITNADGSVRVISTATNVITANITIPSSNVTNANSNVTNTLEPPPIITVSGPSLSQAIAITPNGEYAYVATADGRVAVINTTTNTVMVTVTIGGNPNAVAITPNGEYAYVTNSSAVVVINTANYAVTKTITGIYSPACIAIAPDGKYAYVTNYFNNSVSVINIAQNMVEQTVAAGTNPYGIAISPDGQYAYVTNLAYTATDTPAVNWVGTVLVISTDLKSDINGDNLIFGISAPTLLITLPITIIIAFSIIMVVKKKPWKKHAPDTKYLLSDEKISKRKSTSAETRLFNQAK
jgi:YVTN family beta-propeller protein